MNRNYLTKWVVIGLLIGIVAGLGATAFYYTINLVTNYLLGGLTGYFPPNPVGEAVAIASIPSPRYFLIPVSTIIGGAVAGLLIYRFAPEAEGHGTDAAIDAFHNKSGVIRKRIPLIKTIASAFTIGSGGSAGREGPTAQIAAGFGSIVGGIFRLSAQDRRIAVATGIGAGIGSIFKSPFGGAILSAEILYSGPDIEAEALIPSFIASPVGYVIFASFTGFSPVFGYVNYNFTHPLNLVIYALLGALCAGAGRLYTYSFYSIRGLFERFRISNYFKPIIGGAIAGVVGIFFPEVLGLGYGFLQFLIDGNFAAITTNYFAVPILLALVVIVFVKIFATSFTVGSGGSGGVFAPSLVIGGFVGAALWMVINQLSPGLIPAPAPVVIIGMMALFAGVGRVPIAVVLMVSEMTGTLSMLVPAMVAVVISYYLVGAKFTIYKSQVFSKADSPAHRGEYNIPLMSRITVADAMKTDVITLSEGDTVDRTFALMTEKKIRGIPIVSQDKKVIGMVTISDILRVPEAQMKTTNLGKIMSKNVISISPDASLLEALEKMTTNGIGRLPVVNKATGEIAGILARSDLYKAYQSRIRT
jgi:chloride channel protein, CIC family